MGFAPKEARVYLAALALGESHVSDIAAHVKLPRTTTEVIIEKLRKDGLMNFYVMRRYKYWIAENPERILERFKAREQAMAEALPRLIALKREPKTGPRHSAHMARNLALVRIIADASSQPILITDQEHRITHANAAWEKQFGYAVSEVRGENPRMFQSGETPKEVYARMRAALDAGKMFQSDEVIDRRKDGSHFNLLTTIFPVTRGDTTLYIQILDDITEKKRVEALRKKFA